MSVGTNWLITGGCGFIGSRLIKKIFSDDPKAYIRVIDNYSVAPPSDLGEPLISITNLKSNTERNLKVTPGKIDLFKGDILDSELALRLGDKIDVCVHLAANTGVLQSIKNPLMDCNTNIVGTLNYLESAKTNSIKKFVLASSGAPLGAATPPNHEGSVPHPTSPYGASKLACEAYCQAYFHSFGIKFSALRFSNVYGPGSKRKSSVVAKMIKSFYGQQEFCVNGSGRQTRDFLYIDDLVYALHALSYKFNDNSLGIFQVASSREVSVNELISEINSQLFAKYSREVPIKNIDQKAGEVLRSFSDTTKLQSVIPWNNLTPLNTGIKATIDYFDNLFAQ